MTAQEKPRKDIESVGEQCMAGNPPLVQRGDIPLVVQVGQINMDIDMAPTGCQFARFGGDCDRASRFWIHEKDRYRELRLKEPGGAIQQPIET